MLKKILKDPLSRVVFVFAASVALQTLSSTEWAEEVRTRLDEAKQKMCLREAWIQVTDSTECLPPYTHQTVNTYHKPESPKSYEL